MVGVPGLVSLDERHRLDHDGGVGQHREHPLTWRVDQPLALDANAHPPERYHVFRTLDRGTYRTATRSMTRE
jgi:hypothetical protein